jgi:GNAT superfamily N-acetyltransferase
VWKKPLRVLVREYASSDFPQVKRLMLDAENFGEPFFEPEILNIKKNTTPGLGKVFVANTGERVVGYTSLGRRIFALMIDSIIVDRGCQRESVSRDLVENAKEYAKSQGLHVLRADTGAFMDYAIRFYLACGFEPCGYVEHDFSLGSKQLHFYIDLSKESEVASTSHRP